MQFFTYIKYIFILIFMTVLFSCKEEQKTKSDDELKTYKEPLIKINKYLVKKYAETIESYVKRRKWDMNVTKTGLWYMIYENGNGKKAEPGKIATLNFNIQLLDGTLCYSSDSLGAKKFKISKGGVETGLEEGILFLREGDKARFIMPPYLAHGLIGDDNKIPPLSIIVYDVELLEVSDY